MFIADKSHIGSLPPKRQAYTVEQLIEIYEAAGRSSDEAVLRAKALELYPEILDGGKPPLRCRKEWFGRSLPDGGGDYEHQAWTLCSNLCRNVGIMKDGTPAPF